jgi:hypothetical protein
VHPGEELLAHLGGALRGKQAEDLSRLALVHRGERRHRGRDLQAGDDLGGLHRLHCPEQLAEASGTRPRALALGADGAGNGGCRVPGRAERALEVRGGGALARA